MPTMLISLDGQGRVGIAHALPLHQAAVSAIDWAIFRPQAADPEDSTRFYQSILALTARHPGMRTLAAEQLDVGAHRFRASAPCAQRWP